MNRSYWSYKSHHRPSRRDGGHAKSYLLLACGALIVVGGIVWFRHHADGKTKPVAAASATTAHAEDTITPVNDAPASRSREEATLYNGGQVGLAVASREIKDHVFHHTVVAHLSDPGDGMHYQGWLLRDEPFDFFTTGSMAKNADGTYALVWDGDVGKDFDDYSKVVITIEKDGDTGPSLHVLEGSFGL